MDAHIIGSSSNWVLKGEGNANAVFGYLGPEPALVSTALLVWRFCHEYAKRGLISMRVSPGWEGPPGEQTVCKSCRGPSLWQVDKGVVG